MIPPILISVAYVLMARVNPSVVAYFEGIANNYHTRPPDGGNAAIEQEW